jgi:hypothetical protein
VSLARAWLICLLPALLVLAGCMGPGPGQGDTPLADARTGAVVGLVQDDEMKPLAGALVSLRDRHVQASTDAHGRFEIRQLDPGSDVLVATKLGYRDVISPLTVVAGGVKQLTITLEAIPVLEPRFDDVRVFWGNLSLGTTAGPQPVFGEADTMDFPIRVAAALPSGKPLAAVHTLIALRAAPSGAALDLDLYLLDSAGRTITSSVHGGPDETIDWDSLLRPGDYTIRVSFFAGAKAEFTVTATLTFAQGDEAIQHMAP